VAERAPSPLDVRLERLSKLAGLFLPIIVALVGGIYTYQKDANDKAVRKAQEIRDENQQTFDNTQKQYANLTALLPLLTSGNPSQVRAGLEIYLSEAKALQAPIDLQQTVARLSNEFPDQAALVQKATEAGQQQQAAQCKASPDGVYIQVANSTEQLDRGRTLAKLMSTSGIMPAVQGVQRIDQPPRSTELRYYFSDTNNALAAKILDELSILGVSPIAKSNLDQRYLKTGCQPPAVFELWIGGSTPLQANGSVLH
jgi:hypothetical protein